MSVRRVVPDIQSDALEESRTFYGLLGFEEVMNLGWVMTLASPAHPTAQLTFMTHDKGAPVTPDMSIEVDDVDAVHTALLAAGADIVRPLQDEEWGVRRFFVKDPNGRVVNVLAHQASPREAKSPDDEGQDGPPLTPGRPPDR
ncbi:VOC family protein [Streptomyces sp. NPDC015125]|uniref:VOC family protein n=1 Tax=Streptomyces sp. NPDC015125 TaxID=3364938 RepID=UPI0037006A32